jgi:hypothetical protein
MSTDRISKEIDGSFAGNLDKLVIEQCFSFSASFFALWRSLKMHGENNESVKHSMRNLFIIMKKLFSSDNRLRFTYNGTDLLVNDQRLKSRKTGEDYLETLRKFFNSISVGEVIIPVDVTPLDFILFFRAVEAASQKRDGNIFENIDGYLKANSSKLSVKMYVESHNETPSVIDPAQMAREIYRNLAVNFKDFSQKAGTNQPLPLKTATRTIQSLVNLMLDESSGQKDHLLTLASLNSYKNDHISAHSANVTILSLATAIELGIRKKDLVTVGLGAYLHDIAIDDPLNEGSAYHTELGFSYLSRLNSLNFSMMEAAVISATHHNSYDFNGFKETVSQNQETTPYCEIVMTCDLYDIITRWWHGSQKIPSTRPGALHEILSGVKNGAFANPHTSRALFSVLGMYPHGTVCKVLKQPYLGCVIGRFISNYEPAEVALLNEKMEFCKVEKVLPSLIKPLPSKECFRIPPLAWQSIFEHFQSSNIK